jgi:two-component system sensor histidine kinase PilS (NtrC family)
MAMLKEKHQTTSIPELLAILLVRLSFLWVLVLVSLLMENDDAVFYAFMGIAFIITIPYSLWLRSKMRTAQFAPLQFIVDLVLVTGLIYFTGGMNSDLTLLYPLVILSAGIVGTPKQAAQITFFGIIIYIWMVTMLSQNILVEYRPAGQTLESHPLFPALFLRIFTFICFGLASIHISKRCNYMNQHEDDAKKVTETLINTIQAGILILDSQGHILLANPTACQILDHSQDDLLNQTFTELCTPEKHPLPESYGTTAFIKRYNLAPLPISFRTAPIKLAKATRPESFPQSLESEFTLLTFLDISRNVDLERQLEQVERITAATQIAGEMAHEIRTPLTAISASIQLLKHYEEKATAADWLPNSPRRKDRTELFEHITDASDQMDSVIKNFVDFAEFSPADLLSIIKLDSIDENKGYIGHLNTIGRGFENGQDTDSGRRSNDTEFIE